MRDGSTRWTVDLKDHRRASESVEAPLILGDFGFGDEYCLPMTVQNHVVCDNVGLIDMRDGAVAEIPEVTDFIGGRARRGTSSSATSAGTPYRWAWPRGASRARSCGAATI